MPDKETNKHFITAFSAGNPERDWRELPENQGEIYCALLNLRDWGRSNLSEVQLARYVRLTVPEVIGALLHLWKRGFVKIRFNIQNFEDLRCWAWMHGQKVLTVGTALIARLRAWWGG
jgi:hypothetical protein